MSARSHQRYFPSALENGLCVREEAKCSRCRVEGQRYCLRHIKVESESAYRRCNYISSRTGRRCPNILLRSDSGKEGFCLEHARLVTQVRRQASHRNRFRDTADSLTQSLAHYSHFTSSQSFVPKEEQVGNVKGTRPQRPPIDYYSESSDEDETKEVINELPVFTEDADAEIDDTDEPLKYAGTYTTEEIATLARDKLIKLQSLYCEYFKILALKLKHRRIRYKQEAKAEIHKYGNAVSSAGSAYKDEKKRKELKALRRYRKHFGVDAILRRQAQQMRKKQAGVEVEDEEGCSHPVFPAGSSRYCWLHKVVPLTKNAVDIEDLESDSDESDDEKGAEENQKVLLGNQPVSTFGGPPLLHIPSLVTLHSGSGT